MGKRSDMARVPQDLYPTPVRAIRYLVQHLEDEAVLYIDEIEAYIEPCANNGSLVTRLASVYSGANCVYASDIEPRMNNDTDIDIEQHSVFIEDWRERADFYKAKSFVTNPPWLNTPASNFQLNRIVETLCKVRPTWLLLPASYMMNLSSSEIIENHCTDIVPVGRVKWIEDSKYTGKDDCAWYRFGKTNYGCTDFHSRQKLGKL